MAHAVQELRGGGIGAGAWPHGRPRRQRPGQDQPPGGDRLCGHAVVVPRCRLRGPRPARTRPGGRPPCRRLLWSRGPGGGGDHCHGSRACLGQPPAAAESPRPPRCGACQRLRGRRPRACERRPRRPPPLARRPVGRAAAAPCGVDRRPRSRAASTQHAVAPGGRSAHARCRNHPRGLGRQVGGAR